jgi:hypothetical protein
MLTFKSFLTEEAEGEKLKHITHAEDRPLQHGAKGFEHAVNALNQAHEHIAGGSHSSALTMKYDGSPAVVFGHHPETGKFFVASKSAFNKNPKINYSHEDIVKHHGHAPGLMDKLHSALNHLHKIAPKTGVYQGDMMYSEGDKEEKKGGKVSFTPNTIKYTAKGDQAEKIKNSKMGVIVHTQYHGKDIHTMSADPHPDLHNFAHHPDVWHKSANHDTKHVHYPEEAQQEYKDHIHAAEQIHNDNRGTMYKATEAHRGEGGHLEQYINHTVRTGEAPHAEGFKSFLTKKSEKDYAAKAKKLKTPAGISRAKSLSDTELKQHINHVDANSKHYDSLLKMHNHLQQAKNVLVSHLEQHEGGLEHHIGNKRSKPEGFVVNHAGQPTKLVNRAEFARANLLKVRK